MIFLALTLYVPHIFIYRLTLNFLFLCIVSSETKLCRQQMKVQVPAIKRHDSVFLNS